MRITLFLFIVSIFQTVANDAYSQKTRLSLDFSNTKLVKVLDEIEERSEFYFLYNEKLVDTERKVSVSLENQQVDEILNVLFTGTNVEYTITDRKIILAPSFMYESQQQKSVSGTVVDNTGQPLPGVTVVVKGTTNGTITDIDGKYEVSNIPENSVLMISFVGMRTQEIEVGFQTVINVTLLEDVVGLEEVIVTGYSVERKKDIIGSVSVVDTEEMLSTPAGNVTSQLVGRVSGVTVSSDGSVDGKAKVRIRGFGSFGGSEPLYIIDGVPGDVNRLNPNDIESVQVLKDAASASVYGARAANGVVIITTNQGKDGPVKVSIDAYYGMNFISPNDFPELCDAQEWGDLYFKSMAGAGRSPGDASWSHPQYGSGPTAVIPEYILANVNGSRTGGAALEALRVSDPAAFAEMINPENYDLATHQIVKSGNTDWFDEVYNPAPVTSVQLSASGGSDKGTYAVGMSYFDQTATHDKYEYYRRYTVRANSTYNIRKFLKLGENIQVSYIQGREIIVGDIEIGGGGNGQVTGGNIPGAAWTMPAILPVYDIAGNPASSAAPAINSTKDNGLGNNPVGSAWRERFDGYYTYGMFGNIFAELTPVKDLVIRTSFGLDYNGGKSTDMKQITYENAENYNPPNQLRWEWSNNSTWTWTNTLNYSKTLGSHSMRLLLGSEAISSRSEMTAAMRTEFEIDDDPYFLVLNSGTGEQLNIGTFRVNSLFSYFGRFDYTFADKYIFNATLRRDGSSKFGATNRFGYFPAAAVGWRVTGEDFMSNISWLADLKLRASYGIIGNQTGLSNENQFSTYTKNLNNTYPISGNKSLAQSYVLYRIGNVDARWEKTATTNLGLDASLLDGSLIINADYYIRETTDLLVVKQAPLTGSETALQPSVNVGNIRNTGFDFSVSKRGQIANDLNYNVSANFSTYKNEVLKVLDNPDAVLYGGSNRMGNNTVTRVGDPISVFYGYVTEGFFNSQAEVDAYLATTNNTWLPAAVGRWKIKDVNGDNIVNDNDRTIIGSPHPDFQLGMNMSLEYKGFDFNAFLFWNQGGELVNYSRYNVDFNVYQHNRSKRMLYESWTPELGNDALLPKLDLNDSYSMKFLTDYFVEDATYVRLKTVQLGYSFPSFITDKVNIEKLRVYAQVQNLFTWTKAFTGLDPGVGISGDDLGMGVVNSYAATPKQILFGINLSF